MQVTETLAEGLRRSYAIVVPAADIETKRAKRLAELGRDLRLPGFRPGKVPANLVRKRFGGAVTAEVLEESVSDATRQVLEERGLRSALQPKIEVTSLADERDLEFSVEVELLPEIPMPDFGTISLTRLKAEPDPQAVERALQEIAQRQRSLEPVAEDHPADDGDVVTVDYEGRIDDQSFPGGTGSGLTVEIGRTGFVIPGFAEQCKGIRVGETRTLNVVFPDDYPVPDIKGKPAIFQVTAKSMQHSVVPGVDDALAEKLGFDDLEEMRRLVVTRMQREYDQLSRLRIKRNLLDALALQASFPVPQGLVDAEFKQIWERVEADRKAGQADDQDAAKDDETLQAEYRAIAERRVRLGLLLAEVGRANGIVVAPDEMTRAIRAEAARYPGQEEKVLSYFRDNPAAAEQLRGPIFEEKVVDYILELAEVSDRTVSPEELARDPEEETVSTGRAEAAGAEPGQMAEG